MGMAGWKGGMVKDNEISGKSKLMEFEKGGIK
jgi:hypothetical protein